MAVLLKAHEGDNAWNDLVRVKIDEGDLVPMGFHERGVAGTGALSGVNNDTSLIGVGGQISLSAGAGEVKYIAARGYGRRFAALLGGKGTGSGPLDIMLNRELVYSGDSRVYQNGVAVNVSEGSWVLPFGADLQDDGPHTLEIACYGSNGEAATTSMFDFLGERRFYGGLSYRRARMPQSVQTLTTAYQALSVGGHTNAALIELNNTDTIEHTVLIKEGTFIKALKAPAATEISGTVIPGFAEWNRVDATNTGTNEIKVVEAITGGKSVTSRTISGM